MKNITSIGEYGFYGCTGITGNIDLSGMKTISQYSFSGCTGISGTLDFNGTTQIGSSSFSGCKGIKGIINLDEGVVVNSAAFSECTGITSSVDISQVKSLESSVFSGCTGITGKIYISEETTLGSSIFYGCTGIEEIEIADGRKKALGSEMFRYCTGMKKIKMPISLDSERYSSFVFSGVTNLREVILSKGTGLGYNYYSGGTPWYYSRENKPTITLEEGITRIGSATFSGCSGIEHITLPDTVTSIGNSAFNGCDTLVNLDVPNTIASIGNSAFYGCSSLESEVDLSNVTSIGSYAFYNCKKMKGNWNLSPNLTTIGEKTFYNCYARIGEVNLNNLTSIGDNAFYQCTGITGNVNLTGIRTLGASSFSGCTGITGSINLTNITSIGSYAFNGCSKITEVNISEGVTSLSQYTFQNCTELNKITMPISLNAVYNTSYPAFQGVVNLKEIYFTRGTGTGYNYSSNYTYTPWYYSRNNEITVTFESGIDDIGASTFQNCTRLSYLNIPKSITKVGNSAFSGCTGIRMIKYEGEASDWSNIQFGTNNDNIKNLTTPGVLNNNYGLADTGITLSGNYKIETKIKNVSYSNSYNYIYSTGSNSFETYIDAANKQLHFTNNSTALNSTNTMAQNQAYVVTEEVDNGTMKATVDGDTWITGNTTSATSGSLKLFASSSDNYTTNMIIYYFKLYKEGNLVLDLVPVIRGNEYEGKTAEQNGFYDKVQKKFIYSNNKEFGLEGGAIVCNEK